MRQKKFWFAVSSIVAVLALGLMVPVGAGAASKYKVLYKFKGGADGAFPIGDLIFDTAGNLYGTTGWGGDLSCNSGNGCGTVFELTPSSKGWTETNLYAFQGGNDGQQPNGGVVFDTAGNLYGTTFYGGAYGGGTVFKLAPNSDGSWTESVLYSFCSSTNCPDGAYPQGGLILDVAGNVYGTTADGGIYLYGTVFELMPNSEGGWTESVLHSFGNTGDGAIPFDTLIFDAAGNLYGTTYWGPQSQSYLGPGTVFKLAPNSDGSWKESLLHIFGGRADGTHPNAGVIFDKMGNLYSTTVLGGPADAGTVFKLTARSGGGWAYSVLHVFQRTPALHPLAGLILDKAGNLYGTANFCDSGIDCQGVVFEITP
jgi:uncharacterized repeat protein (TIGR03803 family)